VVRYNGNPYYSSEYGEKKTVDITNSNSILVYPIQFILLGGLDEEKRIYQ